MKQFDDIFRENVKRAFSTYNADHLADEGWNSFAGRKQNRRRRAALMPIWARAASILVLICLGVFIALKISTRPVTQEIVSAAEPSIKNEEEPVSRYETGKEVPPAVPPSAEKTIGKEKKTEKRSAEIQQIYHKGDLVMEKVTLKNDSIIIPGIAESRFLKPDYLPEIPATSSLKELHKVTKPDDLISSDIISEDHKPVEIIADPEKPYRKTTLMAGLSGLIAQSSGTTSPASGLSVGFYVDQKLSRKISIRPGLALAMQSLGLENGTIPSGYNSPVSLNDGTNGIPYSNEGQLSMVAMELPLNIVFRIIDREHSGFYVSAGASTMIYISQQFTADFVNEYTKSNFNTSTGEYSSETRYSTVEIEKDYGAFSQADFLGLANLSAGYSFPYSKTGTMLIEPFIQLPVNNLTSLDLKIRYAGVSMKLNFGKQDQGK